MVAVELVFFMLFSGAILVVCDLSPERAKVFDEQLRRIMEDRHHIRESVVGPVINETEIEICKTSHLTAFKVKSGTKYLVRRKLRWRAANECCRLHGKVLMSEFTGKNLGEYRTKVDDDDTKTDMHSEDAAWTSASNAINERLYEWQSGEDFASEIWSPGEPNNKDAAGNPEGCGHMFYNDAAQKVYLNDYGCSQENNFICEDETPEKINGAEVKDSELDFCRSLDTNFRKYGTKPYYHQDKVAVRWKLADKCCRLHGLDLLSLDNESDEDYAVLRQNIHQSFVGAETYLTWTSGNDFEKYKQFKWGTGESIYDNGNYSTEKKFSFFENYPQSYHLNRQCVQVRMYSNYTKSGEKDEGLRFRNVQCGLLRDFICEPAQTFHRKQSSERSDSTPDKLEGISDRLTKSPEKPKDSEQKSEFPAKATSSPEKPTVEPRAATQPPPAAPEPIPATQPPAVPEQPALRVVTQQPVVVEPQETPAAVPLAALEPVSAPQPPAAPKPVPQPPEAPEPVPQPVPQPPAAPEPVPQPPVAPEPVPQPQPPAEPEPVSPPQPPAAPEPETVAQKPDASEPSGTKVTANDQSLPEQSGSQRDVPLPQTGQPREPQTESEMSQREKSARWGWQMSGARKSYMNEDTLLPQTSFKEKR